MGIVGSFRGMNGNGRIRAGKIGIFHASSWTCDVAAVMLVNNIFVVDFCTG